eukprot:1040586-Prymnesium_polylepis.1
MACRWLETGYAGRLLAWACTRPRHACQCHGGALPPRARALDWGSPYGRGSETFRIVQLWRVRDRVGRTAHDAAAPPAPPRPAARVQSTR